ncbi:MAG TPA: hypothetical protein VFA63_18700 [Pseudonocardiaceae bacterium]|nr:hypothetical protein [Pseudonocardiaceae bacterium]
MTVFVEPTDEQRRAALAELSDADLVGRYWRLEDLDGLTNNERARLTTYRYETFGYEEYCEKLVGHRPRGKSDVADLTAVLDRWDNAFQNLKLWHHKRAVTYPDRNPLTKVLIYEESRISGVRARLHVGVATPPRQASATTPEIAPAVSIPPASEAPAESEGVAAVNALAASLAKLAEAIDRLTESMTRP